MGREPGSLKFTKEKGAKGLMKGISQKVKPMNSENFQPQRALHPTALCWDQGTDIS